MKSLGYKKITESMTWSYSRIEAFNSCPYMFFLKYIAKFDEEEMFFSSYGKFMHQIIEKFYKKEIPKRDMVITFLKNFNTSVVGDRPNNLRIDKYINTGCDYLRTFEPFEYDMIDVEKHVKFEIEGYMFVGYIDFLGRRGESLCIIDNKLKNLEPRKNKTKPTAADIELNKTLRQLYLYSVAIEREYGKTPEILCLNCFKNKNFIKETFDNEKYDEAKKWALDSINKIISAESFEPRENYFHCNYICGLKNSCKYYIKNRREFNNK